MRLTHYDKYFQVSLDRKSAVYDSDTFEIVAATKDGLTWKVSAEAGYPFEGESVNRYDLERWVEAW